MTKRSSAAAYLVVGPSGIAYPDGKGGEKEARPGDVVDDFPKQSIKWMVDDGLITPASDPPSKVYADVVVSEQSEDE